MMKVAMHCHPPQIVTLLVTLEYELNFINTFQL